MPDISLCSGLNCPIRNDCHRFNAKPNSIHQSYIQPPFQIKNGVFSCGLFLGQEQDTALSKAIKKILGR